MVGCDDFHGYCHYSFYIFVLMELVRPGWLTWRKGILHEVPFVVLPLLYIVTEHTIWYYIIAAWAVFYGSATLVLTFFSYPNIIGY